MMDLQERKNWTIEMGVGYIEFFREFCGLSDADFLDYINSNNMWRYFGDYDFLIGTCHWGIDETIDFLGKHMSIEDRYKMLQRYKEKYQDCEIFGGR